MTAQQSPPQAVIAYLSKRKSEKGRTYFAGWLGHSKLLMFKTDDLDKFDNPVWRLIVQEGEVKPGTFHRAPANGDLQPTAPPNPAPGPQGELARRQGTAQANTPPPKTDDGPPPFDDSLPF